MATEAMDVAVAAAAPLVAAAAAPMAAALDDGRQRQLFSAPNRPMRSGDLVIVYSNREQVGHLYLAEATDAILSNKYGSFWHADFIGRAFGSIIESRDAVDCRRRGGKRSDGKKGWIYALAPTPELWTTTLPHRTQVVHQLDASVVAFELGLKPGKVVLESGTGSGAMTGSLARCVAPSGKVLTFEFHEARANLASEEFSLNGLDQLCTVEHRDVCRDGFGSAANADAVFLDLPEPWLAIDFAISACKSAARLASYSPCIEQVQKTCNVLRQRGAVQLRTVEVRLREFDVKTIPLPSMPSPSPSMPSSDGAAESARAEALVAKPASGMRGHTAFLTFATLPFKRAANAAVGQSPSVDVAVGQSPAAAASAVPSAPEAAAGGCG